jgi:hypothetical protein
MSYVVILRVKYFYIGKGMLFCLGECWIQLLQNMNSETLDAAGDMLAEWLSVELTFYQRGIYTTVTARGEPDNYSYLHHRSICRGITEYLQRLSQGSLEPSKIPVTRQCLRILSHNFPRTLPPHNWTFLQQFLQEPDLCHYSLIIASKQASSSESGRRVMEMYLNSFDPSTENVSGNLLIRHVSLQSENYLIAVLRVLPILTTHSVKLFRQNVARFYYYDREKVLKNMFLSSLYRWLEDLKSM